MQESIDRLTAAIESLTKAVIDPTVQAEFAPGDERMLNQAIGALIEFRDELRESVTV